MKDTTEIPDQFDPRTDEVALYGDENLPRQSIADEVKEMGEDLHVLSESVKRLEWLLRSVMKPRETLVETPSPIYTPPIVDDRPKSSLLATMIEFRKSLASSTMVIKDIDALLQL